MEINVIHSVKREFLFVLLTDDAHMFFQLHMDFSFLLSIANDFLRINDKRYRESGVISISITNNSRGVFCLSELSIYSVRIAMNMLKRKKRIALFVNITLLPPIRRRLHSRLCLRSRFHLRPHRCRRL